jgi:hypothetical protein
MGDFIKVYESIKDLEDAGTAATKVAAIEKWREWSRKMPKLKFDKDWEVAVIPPFGGAMARFVVYKGDKYVSVYFDAYSRLGWMYDDDNNPIPYWECYPATNGDAERFLLGQENDLMEEIRNVLNS